MVDSNFQWGRDLGLLDLFLDMRNHQDKANMLTGPEWDCSSLFGTDSQSQYQAKPVFVCSRSQLDTTLW